MAAERVFVDTNILVYGFDAAAGAKHDRAKSLLGRLWAREDFPAISVQVLQEFYYNLVRKGVSPADAAAAVRVQLQWRLVANDGSLLMDGIQTSQRWQLSLWDGLIVAAAKRAGATLLLTEDLNDGQDYGGVKAVNPFKHDLVF